jgi:hypothetical protein
MMESDSAIADTAEPVRPQYMTDLAGL